MEIVLPIAIVLSTFLALNIGANNSAAAMATAYGAGVRSKNKAAILAASFLGIPVSLAEIITSGIIGFSCAQQGFSVTAQNRHVLRIAFFWFIVPFIAIGVGYVLSSIYFKYGVSALLTTTF